MCGIAGALSLNPEETLSASIAQAMCDVIVHRGPDDQGILAEGPVSLGMRRLSIIDLEGGQQPIWNDTRDIAVFQNGEIYNFNEVRRELEGRGHTFRTNSDTEAILHLYQEYGTDCVKHLRGMFAIAIWDRNKRRLFLARDRLGIKPLYYSVANGRLLFGSELKSLLAAGMSPELDRQALHDYLTLTHIPAPQTIFEAARKLEPGHCLIIENGEIRDETWWELDFTPAHFSSEGEIIERIQAAVDDAVRSHLVSDVPLGVFLSGGVDSASLVAGMRRHHSGDLKTFSIGFEEKTFNELDRARVAAKFYDTDHHELIVRPNATELVPELVASFDEPYADSSAIPVLSVARLAREHVTVALSGEGGDEIFAGYKTYSATMLAGWYRRYVPQFARRVVPSLVDRLPVSHGRVSFDYMAKRFVRGAENPPMASHLAWKAIFDETRKALLYRDDGEGLQDTLRLFEGAAAGVPEKDILAQLLAADTKVGLEGDMLVKADRMTMATSLEGRVPLLDHPLVELVASIPSRWKMKRLTKKYLLRKAMEPYLPHETLHGPKQGFNVPIPSWLLGPLRERVRDTLSPDRIRRGGLFRPEMVQGLIEGHESREMDYSRDIWTLLMFQTWQDSIGTSSVTSPDTGPITNLVG